MMSHKALHPNILQRADGTVVSIGEGGFIPAERHKKLYTDAPLPRRDNYRIHRAARRRSNVPSTGWRRLAKAR